MALRPLCQQPCLTLPSASAVTHVSPSATCLGCDSSRAVFSSPWALRVPFSLILVAALSPARLSQDAVVPGATWNPALHLHIPFAETSTGIGVFSALPCSSKARPWQAGQQQELEPVLILSSCFSRSLEMQQQSF